MTEQNNEEVLEMDVEQLQELIGGSDDKLPLIEIDMEDYKIEEFQRGIHDASYISGYIVALLNTGLSEGALMEFLLNQETIKHNLETARINKEMNVEIAKNQRIVAEKNEL